VALFLADGTAGLWGYIFIDGTEGERWRITGNEVTNSEWLQVLAKDHQLGMEVEAWLHERFCELTDRKTKRVAPLPGPRKEASVRT